MITVTIATTGTRGSANRRNRAGGAVPCGLSCAGSSRGLIAIKYEPASGGGYNASSDYIVYGSMNYSSAWMMAHEYGHALHNASLGGVLAE